MKYYLVRHGQTDWNRQKRMQGHRDIPMNEAGIRQIEALAERMKQADVRFDTLIASPLDRARRAAGIIAERTGFSKEIIIDAAFIERDCGALEGAVWSPALKLDDPAYGMESLPALCERARRALERYSFSEDETVLIVSHGATLTALKTVLSEGRLDFHDRTAPIIQGNILCCEKEAGKEPVFYNLF